MSYDAIYAFVSYLFQTGTDTAWSVPLLSSSVPRSHLSRFVQVDLYGGAGSAINAVVPGKSSFAHRNKLFSFQMCTCPSI